MNYSIKTQNCIQHFNISELNELPVGCYHLFNEFGDFVKNHNLIISDDKIYLLTSFNHRLDEELLSQLKLINPSINEVNFNGHPADYNLWIENTTEESY